MEKANEVQNEVKSFKKSSLKKTTTQVKDCKPTQDDIEAEKAAMKEGK